MDISFSKDYKHNYLIIKDDKVLENDYQLKMITNNRIEGLLHCQERMINGEGLLFYEVTSMQSIAVIFELKPVRIDTLRELFHQLKVVGENLSKYVLNGSGLILDPEYIYTDIENKEFYFVYYPFYECPYENNMESLLNYLMEHVDSNDMTAVEAVYQMADISLRQHSGFEEVLEWFEQEYSYDEVMEETYSSSVAMTDDGITLSSPADDVSDIFEEDKQIKRRTPGLIMRFISWLRGYDCEEEELPVDMDTIYSYIGKEDVRNDVQDKTVYIPWVENTEQKLYGTGRNNKYHIDLSKVPLTVGKLKGAVDMTIPDNSISRVHAKFMRNGSKFLLQDLNSTNGSFKNGVRLNPNQQVTIEPGDEIGLGKLKFIYR